MMTERRLRNRPDLTAPQDDGAPRIRVVVADRDGLARRMMSDALREAGMIVPATTNDAREALELARHYHPRIVLVDTALPSHGGVWVVRQIRYDLPETRVLTVSADDDDDTVLAALRLGAAGHIDKDDLDPEGLPRLVVLAANGESIVPRRLLTPLLRLLSQAPDNGWRPVHSRLTTREWEIVDLLAAGASTASIADRLVLAPSTVYSHVKSILRKLGVHSRRDAVAAAERLRREEALGRNHPIFFR